MMRILIADDHAVVRQGLSNILVKAYPHAVCGEARNATELLQSLRAEQWDVVILDINMPGRSGLEVLKDLKQDRPELPVLVLSMHPEDQYAVRTLKAGASGYLNKDCAPDELANAVTRILEGRKYISPALAEALASGLDPTKTPTAALPHESLSDREYQVLCHLAAGKKPGEIADALCLTPQTISTYRTRILEKMDMKTTAELMRYAIENNLAE
ncbi:MAG: response regulator transcription factor [Abitibacteriaceae bacterium]|nr:response regulator transcription factor [Abditibacteriaceae bacterium]